MEIWGVVSQLNGRTLKTLDHSNSFDVIQVGDKTVVVRPHSSGVERTIDRIDIQSAFDELILRGELSRSDIRKNYSDFNPAYVAAIIAEHPNVSVSLKPIVLHYES